MRNCLFSCNVGFLENIHKIGLGIVAWSFSLECLSVIQECFQRACLGFNLKLQSNSPSIFTESIESLDGTVDSDLLEKNAQKRHLTTSDSPDPLRRCRLRETDLFRTKRPLSELGDLTQGSNVMELEYENSDRVVETFSVPREKPVSKKKSEKPKRFFNEYKSLANVTSDWIGSLRK